MQSGMTRSEVRWTRFRATTMRESPPMPEVKASTALTRVLQPPSTAPSGSSLGLPSRRMPMSVVVPPTSMMIASCNPVRALAPMMEAAGPDKMVSTGRSFATDSSINEPSPFTIINGALMSIRSCTRFSEAIRSAMMGMRRALSTAVMVRSLKPRAEESSCPQTTGCLVMRLHHVLDRHLVLRVAHAQVGGDREAVHLVLDRLDEGADHVHVQWGLLIPLEVVSAPHQEHLVHRDVGRRVVADHDEADPAALALHHRVGGQGGGDRHQADLLEEVVVQHLDGVADALGQIVAGGEGFGLAQNRSVGHAQDGGVRVCATGIDPQP